MAVPNFRELGNRKADEVERPKNPPVGHYIWQVTKVPEINDERSQDWTFVTYPVKCLAPCEDVDQADLAQYGDFTKIFQRIQFMFSKTDQASFEREDFKHRKFLEEHLKVWGDGMSQNEAMNAAVGATVKADISWRPDKNDAEILHANINKTMPAD